MKRNRLPMLLGFVVVAALARTASAQGIILSADGPVHRGMGGASTAAPLDAIGALYWNPATTAGLQSELSFGLDMLLPVLDTSSSVAGFGGDGFGPGGELLGLGASNIMAVATGAQVRLTDALYLRGGYTYNQSLYQDNEATIAVLAPIYYQHQLACGASLQVSPSVWFSLAYAYYFEDSLTGPILTPAGPLPGSTLTTTESVHDWSLGITVKY
jgi:long-subunit fatty acid transport protein